MWDGGGIGDGTSNPLGADGIVFVLNTGSNLVGSLGQGVGYQGIAHSVGIKFDTWDDSTAGGFPQDNDPNGNFVGIYTDGSTQFGNAPGDASTVFSPSDSMKNGATWFAWVDYIGNTDDLQVRLSETDVRPTSANLDETIDILNWQFNDSFNPITVVGSVPDQGPGLTVLAVVMLGVCGFAARRTRRQLQA
jgi:MYXO-CTERM domain-containing protein